MKKTLNVNIGSMAFTIDEDACLVLREYLDDISSRLPEDERGEVLEDVEGRIADILRDNLTVPGQVVGLQVVKQAIAIIGRADCFGERQRGATPPPPPPSGQSQSWNGQQTRKLYRSRTNNAIAGLCGGIAEYMGWDITAVRVATLLLILFGGLSLWVYIIMWIVIPMEPRPPFMSDYMNNKQ